MNIEQIASIQTSITDTFGNQSIINIDNLLVININQGSVLKFKNSVKELKDVQLTSNHIDDIEKLNQIWHTLLNQQVKYSFNFIKDKINSEKEIKN